MPDLIQNTAINFAQLRASAADAAVLARRLSGEITDETEARLVLDDLLKRTKSFAGPMAEVPNFKEYDRISSEEWNTFQESVSIDLKTIYDAIVTLEASIKAMEVIARSDLSQTKAAILKAISQLEVYQFLKEHPEFQDLKTISFIRSINESNKRPLAVIDQDVRMLELPAKARQFVSGGALKGRRIGVTTKFYGGGKLTGFNETFSPQNIVDPNPNTLWVEMMSTNAPVEFDHVTSWGTYHSTGAVAEVVITFSHVERVNNFKLLPFSEFPYNVIDISYKESSSSSSWHTVSGFTPKFAVEDWVEFDFPYIAANQIRVTIEQPNYTRNVSVVPEDVFRKNHLWASLTKDKVTRDVHELDMTSRQESLIAAEPEQLSHLIALKRLDKELEKVQFVGERYSEYSDFSKYVDAIGHVVDEISPGTGNSVREVVSGEKTKSTSQNRTIRYYEYLIGIRSVQVSSVTYEPVAYYESPEFVTNGTVVQVQLDTDEIHPVFKEDDGVVSYRKTSIEYEVETSPETRFPIVPVSYLSGDNYIVRDEYVKLVRGSGRLRFTPASGGITVRKNGTRVSMMDLTVSGRDIHVANHDSNAVYTATYSVSSAETKVNIDGLISPTKLIKPEIFTGTDAENKIVLKYYPYVVYEIVRSGNVWSKDQDDAVWTWSPDFYPLSVGTVSLTQGSSAVALTKDAVSDPDFSSIPFGTSGAKIMIWVQELNQTFEIDPAPPVSPTATQCYLKDIFTSPSVSGSRFIIGRTVSHGNRIFGLNIDRYEPVKVLVNGVKAINRTNYLTREHPSFSSQTDGTSTKYEFIQAGKVLYFNGPVKGTIEVTYEWLTQYLKLLATLRCHVPVSTIFTPKIDQARLRVKTTEL